MSGFDAELSLDLKDSLDEADGVSWLFSVLLNLNMTMQYQVIFQLREMIIFD